jgi:hypothetical protein
VIKTLGTLSILALFTIGAFRAFFGAECASEKLSTRQKVEIVYRNALTFPAESEALKAAENEINNLVNHDPFFKKKDQAWVKERIKELKAGVPASGTVALGELK